MYIGQQRESRSRPILGKSAIVLGSVAGHGHSCLKAPGPAGAQMCSSTSMSKCLLQSLTGSCSVNLDAAASIAYRASIQLMTLCQEAWLP